MKIARLTTHLIVATTLCAVELPASESEVDLHHLSTETLPPSRRVVEASLDALPRSLSELQEYERRMRLSALAPRLQVRYQQRDSSTRRFKHVDRVTTRDQSSDNTRHTTQTRISADPQDSFVQESDSDRFSSRNFRETRPNAAIRLNDEDVPRKSIEIRAIWRLSDLVFHRSELRVTQANRTVARYRVQQIEKIVPLYRAFINAVRRMENDPASRQARETVADRLVLLDMLTNNFVSKHAKARFAELQRNPSRGSAGRM